jgi:hypothetical protein
MNWFFSPIRTQRFRTAFLFLGVLIVSASFGLFLSASETSIVRVDEDLARYAPHMTSWLGPPATGRK